MVKSFIFKRNCASLSVHSHKFTNALLYQKEIFFLSLRMNHFLHMYTRRRDHKVPVFILRLDATPICGSCDRIGVSAIDALEAGNVRDARTAVCRV